MSSIKDFSSLNSPSEFSLIYKKPTHCWHTKEFVLFYKRSNKKKVAFIASKKVGKAVARNRAKRLLKSHFINFCDTLTEGSYIFVAKLPLLESNYQKTAKTFNYIFKKLNLYTK